MSSSSSDSLIPSATSSAEPTQESATLTLQAPANLKVVGIILAVVSGLLIGASFVFKKKGLLRSQAGQVAGEGIAYLKSALWWIGMIMMILGEICNFAAYAFVEAIVVTPLGALSVVICAILSSWFLNERLSFFGWLGCGLCILGSVIIALNGPKEASVGQIREFQKLFLAPGFLAWTGVLIAASLVIIFYFARRYGKKSMLWYISVCSMIGGLSVSVTTGLGAAIVQTALGDNQFRYPFMYFLIAFVAVTLLTEVYYLNVALALFNTAMVTPTYYVIFTFFSMVTTIVLFRGLSASPAQIITIVMAFLVICVGITILQMSKVDPAHFNKLDRRSTLLLKAAQSKIETEEEKGVQGIEDPGMDALRGSFGAVGSIIRARSAKRLSQSSGRSAYDQLLYDAPVPKSPGMLGAGEDALGGGTLSPSPSVMNKKPTIKFGSTDVVHQYNMPGTGGGDLATHEHRQTHYSSTSPGLRPVSTSGTTEGGYPPTNVTSSSQAVQPPTSRRETSSGSEMGGPLPPRIDPPLPDIKIDLLQLDDTSSSSPPSSASSHGGNGNGNRYGGGGVGGPRAPKFPPPYLFSSRGEEQMVHSAPATVQRGFVQPRVVKPATGNRFDLKSLFPSSGSGAGGEGESTESGSGSGSGKSGAGEGTESLLSFPSVADSGLSVEGKKGPRTTLWSDHSRSAEDRASTGSGASGLSLKAAKRGFSGRRYPRGNGDDDRDESVRLWPRDSVDVDVELGGGVEAEEVAAMPSGGIRLVQQQPGARGAEGR
ncbi:hypothetical protein AX16_005999 [Volvariella volvacea WC 439]|nr:hypothetical protein AX16_005999 [Volvariella volvacea WC 439]